MNEIRIEDGIQKATDAVIAERLALLCGAGLSMAPPSSIPSAAELAASAKRKYDAYFGPDRPPLPESIDDQAQFFFDRGELSTVYLRTYVDSHAFSSTPNPGHYAIADLLLVRGISTAVSTNVDSLIEVSGSMLYGQIAVGVSRDEVARVPPAKSPLLKVHGCWSRPDGTIWATDQIRHEPFASRVNKCSQWLEMRLLDRDLLIVGYSTDWNYLNQVLESAIGAVSPSRVIVVDPCDHETFADKAPMLFQLGRRASTEFCHVRCSGDQFLSDLRVKFSQIFVRRVLGAGRDAYVDVAGQEPDPKWLEPTSDDPNVLWQARRDLEGCQPHEPATSRNPPAEPLIGLTILQLRARGATPVGYCWNIDGRMIRILRAANRLLHEVEATYSRETPPAIAPNVVVAVGAEAVSLPTSVARGSRSDSIVRGSSPRWLTRDDAIEEFGL